MFKIQPYLERRSLSYWDGALTFLICDDRWPCWSHLFTCHRCSSLRQALHQFYLQYHTFQCDQGAIIYKVHVGSVVQYWWSCTPSQFIRLFWGVRGSCAECHLFSLVSPIVPCCMINILILGCLCPLLFVLKNILTLGILRSATSHIPGCFCHWTFFQNIWFNMATSDPFVSHLDTQLG